MTQSEYMFLLRNGETEPLLAELGFPKPDSGQPALTALHAGAAYHRLAVISDVAASYVDQAQLSGEEFASLDLPRTTSKEPPRSTAKRLYRYALRVNEQLAEAWYNLACLLRDLADSHGALAAYRRAASLPTHPRTPPHALMHANAHWHIANILEDGGRDEEALKHYQEALSRCNNFGVHHARFAHFLRRRGLIEEAMEHYGKLMDYTHRYFPEFVLPTLDAITGAPAAQSNFLDVLYESSDGAAVVYRDGTYYRIAKSMLPISAKEFARFCNKPVSMKGRFTRGLLRLLSRAGVVRRPLPVQGTNIAELEPAGTPEIQ